MSLLGVLLNFICYKVSLLLPEQSTSTILMSYLAIWDTIAGIHDGVFQTGLQFFGVDIAAKNAFLCKTLYYHSYGSTINASWHLAAVAIDRAVSLLFPLWHRARDMTAHSRQVSMSITIFVYFCVLPNFKYFYIKDDVCTLHYEDSQAATMYFNVLMWGFFVGSPFAVILFSNVIFIFKLLQRKRQKYRRRRRLLQRQNQTDNNDVSVRVMHTSVSELDEQRTVTMREGESIRMQNVGKSPKSEHQETSENKNVQETSSLLQTNHQLLTCPEQKAQLKLNSVTSTKSTQVNAAQYQCLSREDIGVIVMLLLACCWYLFMSSTGILLLLMSDNLFVSHPCEKAQHFLRTIVEIPVIINNSVNFLFYYSAGASFRKTFRTAFF